MVDQANFGFLAKQLALTELVGGDMEDIDGGCLAAGGDLWLVLWQPEDFGDPEKLILSAQSAAKEAGKEMGGALLLLPPEKENHPAVAELSEALYLYDYPAAGEDEASNPGLVKVMAKPAFDKATSGNIVPVSWDGPEIAHLLKDALAQDDRTFSANWFQVASNTGGLETLAYMDGDQACGFICTRQAGLAGRVMALWVDPAKRNAGIGTALASRAFDGSASRQELVFTVWNLRKGTLRYFFDKLGFDDQITAMYFIREG